MAYEELEFDWLEELIHPTLLAFYEVPHNRELVERDLNELNLVANIYYLLNSMFEEFKTKNKLPADLDIDLEYNRNREEPKFLYEKCDDCDLITCPLQEGNALYQAKRHASVPDLVIHKRDTNKNNQVVIEFKKQSNPGTRDNDIAKLTFFTCQKPYPRNEERNYQYKSGFLVELGKTGFIITPFEDANMKDPQEWEEDKDRPKLEVIDQG